MDKCIQTGRLLQLDPYHGLVPEQMRCVVWVSVCVKERNREREMHAHNFNTSCLPPSLLSYTVYFCVDWFKRQKKLPEWALWSKAPSTFPCPSPILKLIVNPRAAVLREAGLWDIIRLCVRAQPLGRRLVPSCKRPGENRRGGGGKKEQKEIERRWRQKRKGHWRSRSLFLFLLNDNLEMCSLSLSIRSWPSRPPLLSSVLDVPASRLSNKFLLCINYPA